MNTNGRMIQEDEIDLRELFKTIAKNSKFLLFFTLFSTLLAGVYVFVTPKIYELKVLVEIGNTNTNTNTNTIVAKLNGLFLKNTYETTIKKIEIVKNTPDLIEISAESDDISKAKNEVQAVLANIASEYQSINKKQLDILLQKKQTLKSQQEQLGIQISDLKNQSNISEYMIQQLLLSQNQITNDLFNTSSIISNAKIGGIVGQIEVNKNPIKPKKSLIITVAFVTSLILGIFGVFFIEFLRGNKEDDQELIS
jgi:uncharacterized protein involved in exopolysaccharide biosynthesis